MLSLSLSVQSLMPYFPQFLPIFILRARALSLSLSACLSLSLSLFCLSGESLVPYYRQLLPIFNLLKAKNKNSGDVIDYAQRYYGSIKQTS